MNVRKVKHTTHIWNYFVFSFVLVLAIVSWLLSRGDVDEFADRAEPLLLIPFGLVVLFGVYLLYQVISYWVQHIQMSVRSSALKKAAKAKGLHKTTFAPIGSALFTITKYRPTFTHSYVGQGWGYTDFSFRELSDNFKREIYTTNTYHFAVGVFDLPRALPNVFFDSKHTGSHEFQLLFCEDQRHQLEGDFNLHFDTYFTEDYTIDSLSFITPDVMLALRGASNYDIEIFSNKLYLINDLENMPAQLDDIEQKGRAIRDSLQRNIERYRDDRLPFKLGRKTVDISGLLLRRSSKKYDVMLLLGMLTASIGGLLLLLTQNREVSAYLMILGLGVSVYAITYIVEVRRTNRMLKG